MASVLLPGADGTLNQAEVEGAFLLEEISTVLFLAKKASIILFIEKLVVVFLLARMSILCLATVVRIYFLMDMARTFLKKNPKGLLLQRL